MDVGKNSSLRDGDFGQQFVQFIVVLDGKLKVARDDPGPLVVTGGVASQLEDLGSQVLQDSGHIDSCSFQNSGCVVSLLQVAKNSWNWKLKTRAT